MTETASSTDEEIIQSLGRAASLFSGGLTLLVRTCHAQGLAPILGTYLERVYLDAEHIRDPRISESLLSLALHHCDNQYCYLIHSAWMLDQAVSVEQIANVLQRLEVPEGVVDRDRWSTVLRCTYFAFMDGHTFGSNVGVVRRLLSEAEYQDYVQILALAGFLRTLLLSFPDQIDAEREPLLTRGALAEKAQRILSISQERIAKRSLALAEGSRDIVTLCMYCKDLRTEQGNWRPIESCIDQLSPNTMFSHGICERCFEREFPEELR